MSIAIFDSGLGGLSITEKIREETPNSNIHYLSDNQAFPYGPKSQTELIERVSTVVDKFFEVTSPKILVIACNTASTLVLSTLRNNLTIPVVGVIPAIKPAALYSKTKQIALLATPGTVKRSYTDDLINEFAKDCDVLKIGTSNLVEIAEKKLHGHSIDEKELSEILQPIKDNDKIDTVVLGCTHFPLIKKEIANHLQDHIKLIDSGEAIAQRVKALLETQENQTQTSNTAYFTKSIDGQKEQNALNETLGHYGFENAEIIVI